MGLVQATKSCLRNAFDFTGRATRSEFWWFQFLIIVIAMLLGAIEAIITDYNTAIDGAFLGIGERLLIVDELVEPNWGARIFTYLSFIPGLSVTVRRFHDIGRRTLWVLLPTVFWLSITVFEPGERLLDTFYLSSDLVFSIGLISFLIVFVMFLVLLAKDGEPHSNIYGPSLKHGDEVDAF